MRKLLTTTLAALLCAASVFAQAPAGSWQPLPASGYWQHLLHLGANFQQDMFRETPWKTRDPFEENGHGSQTNQLPFPGLALEFDPSDVHPGAQERGPSASTLVWTEMTNSESNPDALWSVGGNYPEYVKYWHVYILHTGSVDRAVTVWGKHDDGLIAWNNGNVFYSNGAYDGGGAPLPFSATLHPGVNSITIKLDQGGGTEYMGMRVTDRDNNPIDDLFYALMPDNPAPVVTALAHNAVTLGECLLIDR